MQGRMENLMDLMQEKLIFTYIFCLKLLDHEQMTF